MSKEMDDLIKWKWGKYHFLFMFKMGEIMVCLRGEANDGVENEKR